MRKQGGGAATALIIMAIIAGAITWSVLHRVQLLDWWWFQWFHPDAKISALADDAGMSDLGKHWFYRGGPTLVGQDELSNQCGKQEFGCITDNGSMFILTYDPNNQAGTDAATVAASEDMLHMAWRRTPKADKTHIKAMLLDAQTSLQDASLNQRIAIYTDDDQAMDQLHAILGSEYPNLPSDLENYYSKYLQDRSKVTTAAQDRSQN